MASSYSPPLILPHQVPQNFDLVSQRKGFKRYLSPRLRELVAALDTAKEGKEDALTGILQV